MTFIHRPRPDAEAQPTGDSHLNRSDFLDAPTLREPVSHVIDGPKRQVTITVIAYLVPAI
jgi:hypothetical protein